MNTARGVFVVIEGTDGSGKGTQFDLLAKRLEKEGFDVATFDFPQYDQPSSYFITQYLNGNYGTAEEVGPFAGSIFYALDRFEASSKIREALEEGKVVLANRYVGSNMAHQGTKFDFAEERRGYFIWLDNLEFEMFKIPRPSLSFVLRVPAETAYKLVGNKEKRCYTDKKRDIHEADINHLAKSVEVYDDLCELFPKDFVRIDCTRDDQLLDIGTIHDILWQKIEPLLPSQNEDEIVEQEPEIITPDKVEPEISLDNYYIPVLPEKLQNQYRTGIDEIIAKRAEIGAKLTKYLERSDHIEKIDVDAVLRTLLPVATVKCELSNFDQDLAKISEEMLPAGYANSSNNVKLAHTSPRNELEIVPHLLYAHADLSISDLKTITGDWSYDKKVSAIETYLKTKPNHVLNKITYSWDMFTDFATYLDFADTDKPNTKLQILTPRYGYDVPEIIEEAGLTDDYEDCFALSLKLHSLLHGSSRLSQAQYATLLGHKVRWQLNLTGDEVAVLFKSSTAKKHGEIIALMRESIADTHPTVAEGLISPELRHL